MYFVVGGALCPEFPDVFDRDETSREKFRVFVARQLDDHVGTLRAMCQLSTLRRFRDVCDAHRFIGSALRERVGNVEVIRDGLQLGESEALERARSAAEQVQLCHDEN